MLHSLECYTVRHDSSVLTCLYCQPRLKPGCGKTRCGSNTSCVQAPATAKDLQALRDGQSTTGSQAHNHALRRLSRCIHRHGMLQSRHNLAQDRVQQALSLELCLSASVTFEQPLHCRLPPGSGEADGLPAPDRYLIKSV